MQHLIQHLHQRVSALNKACQTRYLYQAFHSRLLGVAITYGAFPSWLFLHSTYQVRQPGFGAVLSLGGPEGFTTFPQPRSIITERKGERSRTACRPFPIACVVLASRALAHSRGLKAPRIVSNLGLFEAQHLNPSFENVLIRPEISDSDYRSHKLMRGLHTVDNLQIPRCCARPPH